MEEKENKRELPIEGRQGSMEKVLCDGEKAKEDRYREKRHTHPSGQEVGGPETSKNLKRSMIVTIELVNVKSWCAPK